MAYNGSVELISGIKQKNNGTFALVDASAVRVTDSKRLDAALAEKLTANDIDTTLSVTGKAADAAAVGAVLDEKVDKVSGKGLSENDFTDADKAALDNIKTTDTTLSVAGKAADAATVGAALENIDIDLDETLTQPDMAADAKATGDAISELAESAMQFRSVLTSEDDLDDVKTIGLYRCAAASLPANRPTTGSSIVVVNMTGSGSGTAVIQCYYTAASSFFRYYTGGAWYDWYKLYTSGDELMDSKNALASTDNCNDVLTTGFYRISSPSFPKNMPVSASGVLVVYPTSNSTLQCYYSLGSQSTTPETYFRFRASSSWGAWTKIYTDNDGALLNFKRILNNADNLNSVTDLGIYRYSGASVPTNAPDSTAGIVVVNAAGIWTTQVYFNNTAAYFRFYDSTTWGSWIKIYTSGDGQFFTYQRALNNTDNLNNITTSGYYRYSGTSIPSNAPDTTGGVVVVNTTGTAGASGTIISQVYYGASSTCFRIKAGTSDWQAWNRITASNGGTPLQYVRVLANYTDESHPQEDANSVTDIGLYRVNKSSPTSYMPLNIPEKEAGVLVVYNLAGRLIQQYYTAYNTYFRFRNTGSTALTPWVRLRNSSEEVMEYIRQLSIVTEDTFAATTTTGFYRCVGTNTPLDAPERVTGVLCVYHADASSVQVYYTVTNHVYSRIKTSGSWGPWKNADAGEITSLPVLDLTGDTTGMSKDTKVTLGYSIFGLTGELTCKWQGSSSLRYPKKNYTITFDNKFDAWNKWCSWVNSFRAANGIASRVSVPNPSRWGQQKKYCMKANWIDPSMARNVVCARLWGQIVASRQTSQYVSALAQDDLRLTAPNYGAIDGFPCEIKINGMSNGLYTFNIPKDKWTFAMGSADTHYVLCGENNGNNACMWKAGMGVSDWDSVDEYDETASYSVGDYVYYDDTLWRCNTAIGNGGESWTEAHWTSYFAVEYVGDDIPNKNPLSSLDEAIQLIVSAGAGWDSDPDILAKLDVDSAFDYFIFACCLNCHDGLARNMLYGTYDGVRWFLSAYDLDTTFGSDAYSTEWYGVVNDRNQFAQAASMNRLAYLMVNHASTKLKNRYHELRSGILSNANVWHELSNFVVDIPTRDYDVDRDRWQVMPGTATANTAQYMEYYRMHCDYLDAEIDAL